jgi:hypothetical protein
MDKYTRKQGDSLWIDITCTAVADIDPVWANWGGTWCVSTAVGKTALLSGVLIPSVTPGLFSMRIGPNTAPGVNSVTGTVPWATLPVGLYVITVQIDNLIVDYRHEDQGKLAIQPQGMLA